MADQSNKYAHRVQWPRISIVMPTLNQGAFIEEALKSIVDQHYPNLELIVVDGGSTDNTLDVIRSFESHISWWVSEPDDGQSHAINKGVARVKGDIFNWINSDDVLLPDALLHIADLFLCHSDAHAVSAKSVKFGEVREEMTVPRHIDHPDFEHFIFQFWLMQPSTFMRSAAFLPLFPLNEKLHFSMDTDLFIRYFLQCGPDHVVYSHIPIVRFRMHGGSKSVSAQLQFNRERMVIDQQVVISALGADAPRLKTIAKIDMPEYVCRYPVQPERLRDEFIRKWGIYDRDPSAKYRVVAEYAGWYGHRNAMRSYSQCAVLANPLKLINWKYLFYAWLR